ncbi:MAG: hypothetical protein K6G83_11865 [Lachnospiraceae bacterium]|nr:hypothetical protein [Lachnospiraceae bacterium]
MSKDALNESTLDQVSGGGSKTSYGYDVDDAGNVHFIDKTNADIWLTHDQWEKLKSNWNYTGGNPEAYLKDVTIADMKKAGLIPG